MLDLWVIALIIAALIVAWSGLSLLLQQHMRWLAVILALLSLAAIIYATLFSRTPMDAAIHPIPFSSFARATVRPELYRSMLMNVFLFVPLGLSLPFVLRGSTAKRILLTVLIGFLLSVSIETIQYLFSLGLAEADDVLCNTLGAAVGSTAYRLFLLWNKLKNRQSR
ncbi:MAG: VanZ family protein [Clostridia bacterium]|nr:VanZ family protein [Clostridia bacterium]